MNVEYDSGDYEKSLAEALRLSDYDQMLQYRDAAWARGELVGVGVSTFVEPSGGVGFESATVRVERTGEITVLTGSSPHGQGLETAFAQVAAEKLHVAMERGDSPRRHAGDPAGRRHLRQPQRGHGRRGIGAGVSARHRQGPAYRRASGRSGSRRYRAGRGGFAVAGVPDKKITWRQIAASAYGRPVPGLEPGLQETVFFDPGREAWGFGAHVALVRIDRDTGQPRLEKLVLVDDCGVIINPMIVEGQVHGGWHKDSAKRSTNKCSTATTASRSPPR